MSTDVNLSGSWVGEYRQFERSHPIEAELIQSGESLSGSMRDADEVQELSVSDLGSGVEDEQIVARLRELFPDEPIAPVRYVAHLPPKSTLEGWVRGSNFYFLKSYQGLSYGGFRMGERMVGSQSTDDSVHYSGRIARDGSEIEGRWWIDPTDDSGGRRTEGSFLLQRKRESTLETEVSKLDPEPNGAEG